MAENTKNDAPIIKMYIDTDGIIQVIFAGNFYEEYAEEYRKWAKNIQAIMREKDQRNEYPILTLIDVSGLEHFDFKIGEITFESMQINKKYATRTALFGASPSLTTVMNSMAALTRRKNYRVFPTKEAALEWLLHDDDKKPDHA